MRVDGLVAWYRGQQPDYESKDFVFVTIWRDKDALRQLAGASAGPVMFGNEHELAKSISVEQFEIAD